MLVWRDFARERARSLAREWGPTLSRAIALLSSFGIPLREWTIARVPTQSATGINEHARLPPCPTVVTSRHVRARRMPPVPAAGLVPDLCDEKPFRTSYPHSGTT